MSKRGTVDFREGLGLLKETFKAEAEAARAKAQQAAVQTPRPAPPVIAVAARLPNQQPAKPKFHGSAKAKTKKPTRPPPRLGPTNVPPNPGRYATGVLEPIRRPAPVPARDKTPAELQGKDALAYVASRIDLSALRSEASLPTTLAEPTLTDLTASVAIGSKILLDRPGPDEGGYLVGFDFGTSSSKIVVHQTGAGDLAYAVRAPDELCAEEQGRRQQHLWRSVVWFDAGSGRFSLAPQPGAVAIEGFKTGLIQSTGHRMTGGVTHAHAAVAYLALLIAFVVGEHRRHPPAGFDGDAHFSRFHFGVPVACKDEAGCADEFQRVLTAAFEVAPFATDLDLETVKAAHRRAAAHAETTADSPFVLFEELAGVIAGYKASPDHRRGPHVIVDVGASTLDVATFHIPDGDHKVLVFMSSVGLLGAEALRAARRSEVPDPTFRAACAQHTRHVLSTTFLRKDSDFFPLNGIPKPLLFVGGGRLTDVHDELYGNYPNRLEAPRRTPAPGPNLQYDMATDFARLLLAWGLAQEQLELPVLKPPSEIEDEVRRRHYDYRDRYVDKDMC
jgi:hypothetical protein